MPSNPFNAKANLSTDYGTYIYFRLAALEEAGLGGYGARMPSSLSGGQRSRVSLLRALLAAPAALLLDEPFSKLDVALRAQMREFTFGTLAARAVPALIVTHDEADIPASAQLIRLDDA